MDRFTFHTLGEEDLLQAKKLFFRRNFFQSPPSNSSNSRVDPARRRNTMKKLFALLTALALMLSLASCGGQKSDSGNDAENI